ncbi:MAG TPA: helix-turn-helix domain-containing protein [Ktedonobacterales bacterium]
MMLMNGEEYLTADETCSLLGVKAATLYTYVSRGVLKSYRQGMKRQRLYKRSQVEDLLEFKPSGGTEATPEANSGASASLQSEVPLAESWIPYT